MFNVYKLFVDLCQNVDLIQIVIMGNKKHAIEQKMRNMTFFECLIYTIHNTASKRECNGFSGTFSHSGGRYSHSGVRFDLIVFR